MKNKEFFSIVLFVFVFSFIPLIFAQTVIDSDLDNLKIAHNKISALIHEKSTFQNLNTDNLIEDSILFSFIDYQTNELVVVLDYDTSNSIEQQTFQLQTILGEDVSLNVSGGVFVEYNSCSASDEPCNPIIGGLKHGTLEQSYLDVIWGTMTLPFTLQDSRAGILTSGHVFDVGDLVTQPSITSTVDYHRMGEIIFDTRPNDNNDNQ